MTPCPIIINIMIACSATRTTPYCCPNITTAMPCRGAPKSGGTQATHGSDLAVLLRHLQFWAPRLGLPLSAHIPNCPRLFGTPEAKALLKTLQHQIVEAQAEAFCASKSACQNCGRRLRKKGRCVIRYRTVFGDIPVTSRRYYRCCCQGRRPQTFIPLTDLLPDHTAPEAPVAGN